MPTKYQNLGIFGEEQVAKKCSCPRCKRSRTFKRLPPNFKCADLICDFCGFLAQVKAKETDKVATVPKLIPGAAWKPQADRMTSAIYFPLYLVLVLPDRSAFSIFYLPADLQDPGMFKVRNKLSETAKRAGWQGFHYDLSKAQSHFAKLV